MTPASTTTPAVDRRAAAAIVVTMVLWASAFVGIRYAGAHFHPGSLALGRLLVGAVTLGVFLAVSGQGLPDRTAWKGIAGAGVFWFGAYTVALNWGEQHTDAGTAALIVGVGPLILAVLSGFLLKEGFPRPLLLGLGIAFVGTAVAAVFADHSTSTFLGVALCLVSAAGYSIGVLFQKAALGHASALQVTTLAVTVGAIACLPFGGQLIADIRAAPSSATWGVAYLGVFPTALAFWTWASALSRTSAGKLGATTYLVPVIVIILSWLLLSEIPGSASLMGGALCLAGVAVSRRRPRPQRPARGCPPLT